MVKDISSESYSPVSFSTISNKVSNVSHRAMNDVRDVGGNLLHATSDLSLRNHLPDKNTLSDFANDFFAPSSSTSHDELSMGEDFSGEF